MKAAPMSRNRYPGDLPFAIPEQRRDALVIRLAMQRYAWLGKAGPVFGIERPLDGDHPVERCLIGAGVPSNRRHAGQRF